jgi:hypothetical protein
VGPRFRQVEEARALEGFPSFAMVNVAKPADIAGFPRVGRYWG